MVKKQKTKKSRYKQILNQPNKQLVSWLVTFVLIIQVVVPGGLFQFPVQKANAAVTTALATPDTATDWDIGDSEDITWLTDNGGGANPDYYKLYYSEDSGSSWNSIDDNVPFTDAAQLYSWDIPVVNGAGEEDFSVKIEAYYNPATLVASDESDDFKIDYGVVDSFVVDAPAELADNPAIDSYITAKDQYGNTIVNFPATSLNWTIVTGDVDVSAIPDNGVTAALVFINGVTIVDVPNNLTTDLTFSNGKTSSNGSITFSSGVAEGVDTVTWVKEIVVIDAPTAASSFVIGTSGNSITFRAGGETTISYLNLDYAPDGSTWTSITTGLVDTAMPQTYSWTIPVGTPGATWKIRVKSYDATDTLLATGTSAAFTVAYGSVASFVVAAPDAATVNKFFSLTVTAKDTYGNTITTFNNTVAIGASPGTITPVTIGNGSTTGSWSNGVVTYNSFAIGAPGRNTITATYSGATGQDEIAITGGGSAVTGCYKDVTAPASNVMGILDANNKIIPIPTNTYKGPITVVVEAQDPYMDVTADGCPLGVGVDTAELYLRKGANDWEAKGNGTYFMPSGGNRDGYDYYKWTLDVPVSTYVTWYFYSMAVDYDDNAEEEPGIPGYDALTTINTFGPYLSVSNPINQQKDVAINSGIILTFSQPMDRVSTQAALKITRVDGVTVPELQLTYSWGNSDKTLTVGHRTAFLYNINYKVTIDPAIATNKNGINLITSDPLANPNPFTFTTATAPVTGKPYLATSTKAVNMLVASPGATPLYTIVLRNTGAAATNVTFRDSMPTNTVYDNLVTNATYDPVANAIIWNGPLARNGTRTITFRVKIKSPLANGTEILNTAYINDGTNPEIQKYAVTVITSIPSSKVTGIIDKNGTFVPVTLPATPINVYFSPLTIVAEVQNNASVANTDLWYRPAITGSVWTNYGPGVKLQDNPDGSAQYKWEMNVGNQNRTYYFYTRSSDGVGNIEGLPPTPGYDMRIYAYTIQPYITVTTPAANQVNVSRTSFIQVTFSQQMDPISVQDAIKVTLEDGSPLPPELIFAYTWYNNNRTVRLTHTSPFAYRTKYKVLVDPTIAMSKNGVGLNAADPLAKPNPWTFKTTEITDFSVSVKGVNKENMNIQEGDILLYTVIVDNSAGGASGTVTVTDPIPLNTTYANYASGGLVYQSTTRRMYWRGTVPAGMSRTMSFQVRVNKPINNGITITNIATMQDSFNLPVVRTANTLIGSTADWSTSTRTIVSAPTHPDGLLLPGDMLLYTITAKNTGSMNAVPATITDTLPEHATLDATSLGTNGFTYNSTTNTLSWSGNINVNQTKVLNYAVQLDSNIELFRPPNNKASNQTSISGGSADWVMPSTLMMNVPADPTDPCPGNNCGGRPGQPPYITEQINPGVNATSVKLYSSILVPFSKVMDPASIAYEVWIGTRQIDTSAWQSAWDSNGVELTLTPSTPLEAGEKYLIHVTEGVDGEGLGLITDGPIYNNEWSFTAARPALYFSDPKGPISFLVDTVFGPITLKLGDWINFPNKDTEPREYIPYTVEKSDLILNLESTSSTGRFGLAPLSEFFTKEWGPWYNNPKDPTQYLKIPVGQDSTQFYYTDKVQGYHSINAADLNQGYAVVDTPSKPVIATSPENLEDQIYFESDSQSIPVNNYSNPIIFGVMNHRDNVWLTEGRAFLLSSNSPTGQFYTYDKRLIDETVTFTTNSGPQTYYRHYIQTETITETIFYKDTIPGTYTLTIVDGKELGVVAVGLQAGLRPGGAQVPEGGPPAASGGSGSESEVTIATIYSDRVAKSAGQNINILPLETQEYDEILEELEEIKDNTGRILNRIEINPEDVTVLPGGIKAFTAKGYDTEGKEIEELVFSWYIVAGGGTIMKRGLSGNNHTSLFTAGRVPGVYYDTVMVAAYYNGMILADTATVRVARVINYGAPGQLPSTGPNGLQLIFMILTLISAVALAAVEHYEKTYLAKKQALAK